MKNTLSKLLVVLSKMRHEEITNVNFEEGTLAFDVGGGKFHFIATYDFAKPNEGYLQITHKITHPLSPEIAQFIKVPDFLISVILIGNYPLLKITKCTSPISQLLDPPLDENGMKEINYETLVDNFVKEFIAKLKQGFVIHIYIT